MLNSTREDRVREFFQACGKQTYDPTNEDGDFDMSILNCIVEEANEFCEAVEDYTDANYNYLEDPSDAWRQEVIECRRNLVKEWADLQYVTSQAAIYFDIPADASFNRVHASNLSKIGPNGEVSIRSDGKIVKPADYEKPEMSGL